MKSLAGVGVWIVALMVPLFFGCVSSGNPAATDQVAISQIKIGTTTKEDVRRLLGNPSSIGKGSGNLSVRAPFSSDPRATPAPHFNYEVWGYSHISVETDAATFIPIVGLFAGGATSSVTSVTIHFDEKGIVQYVQTTESQGHSGMGTQNRGRGGNSQEEN